MTVYSKPLTEEEIKSCVIGNKELQATIKIHLSEIITCNGFRRFDDFVKKFFPSIYLTNILYRVVGYEPLSDNDDIVARGFVYVQITASIEKNLSEIY